MKYAERFEHLEEPMCCVSDKIRAPAQCRSVRHPAARGKQKEISEKNLEKSLITGVFGGSGA